MEELLRVKELKKSFVKGSNQSKELNEIKVLKGLNFSVNPGEYIGIMGRSGCGKTTLLKLLGFIDEQSSGEIYFKGQNTKNLYEEEVADIRRRDIGFVFQDFNLVNSLSVRENIMMPVVLDKKSVKECLERTEFLAKQFEILHLLDKNPYELSGGEQQKVSLCRALINNPEMVLADEPTGNLDTESGQVVVNEFNKINKEYGKTVIMVTHDPIVACNCQRIIYLRDGMIVEEIIRKESKEAFYNRILNLK